MSPPLASSPAVWCVLIATGSAGFFVEERHGWGSIFTFLATALLSNLGAIPSHHAAYEACWQLLLPVALALILLGSTLSAVARTATVPPKKKDCDAPPPETAPASPDRAPAASASPDLLRHRMRTVGVSFVLGALASILGGYVAFFVATNSPLAPLRLSVRVAAQCAACLVATYIGGCVNFFAVAAAVGLMAGPKLQPSNYNEALQDMDAEAAGATDGPLGASLLGGLCAADIVLMGVYLASLEAIHRMPAVRRLFPDPLRVGFDTHAVRGAASVSVAAAPQHPAPPKADEEAPATCPFASAGAALPPGHPPVPASVQGERCPMAPPSPSSAAKCPAESSPLLPSAASPASYGCSGGAAVQTGGNIAKAKGKGCPVTATKRTLAWLVDPSNNGGCEVALGGFLSLLLALVLCRASSAIAASVCAAMNMRDLGVSTVVLTALALATASGLRRVADRWLAAATHRSDPKAYAAAAVRGARRCCPTLASLALQVFFAGVGASARLADFRAVGVAVSFFTSLVLLVHLASLLLAARVLNTTLLHDADSTADLPGQHPKGRGKWLRWPRLPLDDLLVASNANVGGPGTAATMAGGSFRRDDLVLPATAYGIVGYAVATTVGVLMFEHLSGM